MSYTVYTTPAGRTALRKLPKDIQQHLKNVLTILETKPNSGEQLKGEMSFIRSLHTRLNKTDYRVAYEVIEHAKEVLIHVAGPRENFYKYLKQMKLKRAR